VSPGVLLMALVLFMVQASSMTPAPVLPPGPAAPRVVCWPTPSPERRPFVCCRVANRLLSGPGQPLVRMVRFGRRRRGPCGEPIRPYAIRG
jgi:hypothetical protein